MHVSNKNHSGPFTELSYNSSDNMPQMLLKSIKSNHLKNASTLYFWGMFFVLQVCNVFAMKL